MFAFDRSAAAVLVPLALVVAVVLWSRMGDAPAAPQQSHHDIEADQGSAQTVAANFPSR